MKNLFLLLLFSCLLFNAKSQEHFYDFTKIGNDYSHDIGRYYNNGNYFLMQGKSAELYASDGTTSGTVFLRDFSPDGNIFFSEFQSIGKYTFFNVVLKTSREMWCTDGTAAGTKRVNTSTYRNGTDIGVFKGWVFYTYITDNKTFQVRRIDTTLTKDSLVGTYKRDYDNYQAHFAASDSFMYYNHDDSIFRVDKNLGKPKFFWERSSSGGGDLIGIRSYKNILLWYMRDYSNQTTNFYVMKEVKGTSKLVLTLNDWYSVIDAEGIGNSLFFTAKYSLHKVDISTLALTTLTTTAKPLSFVGGEIIAFQNKIFFQGQQTAAQKTELWSTNTANTATQLVATISSDTGSTISQFNIANNKLYFNAYTMNSGREMWKSDGTTAGTSMLLDIMPGYESSIIGYYPYYYGPVTGNTTVFNNQLYFSAYTNAYGNEPWTTDGTSSGTKLFKDINNTFRYGDQEVSNFMVAGDYLYMAASDSINGAELWRTDGTENGTILVHNISPAYLPSGFSEYTEYKNKLFMTAFSFVEGDELYTSNGFSGTTNSYYVTPSDFLNGSSPHDYQVLDPYMFFAGRDGFISKDNLFRSDGTKAGTLPLNKGISNSYSNVSMLRKVGQKLYFSAEISGKGLEPWTSDGTLAGTKIMADIRTGTTSSEPVFFCGNDSMVYFSATDASAKYSLYKASHGSAPNKVFSFSDQSFLNTVPDTMFYNNGKVFFKLKYAGSSFPLAPMLASWDVSTAVFTILQALSGETYINPSYMKVSGNKVFFNGSGSSSAREPWVTDGTRAGTFLLKDIANGSASSEPSMFTAYNGLVYFSATNAANGREAWVTDGTPANTRLLYDIFPGTQSSNPTAFMGYKGYVYISASQANRKNSLFRVMADSCQKFALRLRNSADFNAVCGKTELKLFVESGDNNAALTWYRNDTALSFTNDTVMVDKAGLYKIRSNFGACASESNSLNIEKRSSPDVKIGFVTDSFFCEGTFINMQQTDAEITTRWFKNNVFAVQGKLYSTNTSGKIFAVGTNALGCSDTSNVLNPPRYPKPVAVTVFRNDSLVSTAMADSFAWTYNGVYIPGSNIRGIKPNKTGSYQLNVFSKGCKATSTAYAYTKVGIEETSKNNFSVYPNPANSSLNINLSGNLNIIVTDVNGRICLTKTLENGKLDISQLENGFYVIRVETGDSVYNTSFIKAD